MSASLSSTVSGSLTIESQNCSIDETTATNSSRSIGFVTYAFTWCGVRVEDVPLGCRRGQHQDRDLQELRVALDRLEHLLAVHPRQVEVEDHEIGTRRVLVLALLAQELHRLLAVLGHEQLVGDLALLQDLLGQPDVRRLILDEEDLDGLHRHHGPGTSSPSSGQDEPERAAAARRLLDPDAPAVALDDLLADREPDARCPGTRPAP